MEITVDNLTVEQIKQYNPQLFKAIQDSKDPEVEIKALTDNFETEKTTNKELSKDNDTLRKEAKETKDENENLKKENDEFKAQQALTEKKIKVEAALKEADLPKELVTDHFRDVVLMKAKDDDEMAAAIADRKQIAEANKGRITESGEEFNPDEKKDKDKDATKEQKSNILESVKR